MSRAWLTSSRARSINRSPTAVGSTPRAIAVEQPGTDGFLQHLQAAGQRRLGQPERVGGPSEAAVLIEGQHVPALAQINIHEPNLSNNAM
jgi:hypothetical protein